MSRGAWERLAARGFAGRRGQAELGIAARAGDRLRLPERYRRLAVQAAEEEKITEGELARLLRCTRVEARETAYLLTRSDEVGPGGHPYALDLDFGEPVEVAPAERGEP